MSDSFIEMVEKRLAALPTEPRSDTEVLDHIIVFIDGDTKMKDFRAVLRHFGDRAHFTGCLSNGDGRIVVHKNEATHSSDSSDAGENSNEHDDNDDERQGEQVVPRKGKDRCEDQTKASKKPKRDNE